MYICICIFMTVYTENAAPPEILKFRKLKFLGTNSI